MSRALTWIWALVVAAVLASWLARPTLFSQVGMADALSSLGRGAVVAYVVLSLVRGLTLVPSTPVVLAGAMLFPHEPGMVLVVSMIGIVLSAALVYRFPTYAGWNRWLESNHPERIARLRSHLNTPRAPWFVALWAFLPVVPTDLVCYVAGLARMPLPSLLIGIVIGELPVVTAYIFVGSRLTEILTR